MRSSLQSAGAAAIIAQEQPFGQSRLALIFKPLQVIEVGQIVGGLPIDGDGAGQQFGAFNPNATDGTENAVGVSLYRVVTTAGSTVRSQAVVRDAEVYHRSLIWPADINGDQKAQAIKQLYMAGIVIK